MSALETDKTTKKEMADYKASIKVLKALPDDEYQVALNASNQTYNKISETLSAGATFYKQIHQYITTLKMSAYDFAYSRQIERDELAKQLSG